MAPQQQQQQQPQQQQSSSAEATVVNNRVRLFGSSWTKCGYCHGERAQTIVLTDASSSSAQQKQQQQGDEGQAEAEAHAEEGEQTSAATKASSKAYSILVFSLTPAVYEAFIERGWRRSGRSLYKPDNWVSCCPLLSIRLPVQEFTMSKSQRKVLGRMERLLLLSSSSSSNDGTTRTAAAAFDAGPTTTHAAAAVPDSSMTAILEQLENWTNEALREILAVSGSSEDGNNSTAVAAQTAATSNAIPRAKFTFRTTKQKKGAKQQQQQQQQHQPQSPCSLVSRGPATTSTATTTSPTIPTRTAVTSICAAIAGKSKGKIDRSALSLRLVEVLQIKAYSCIAMMNTGKRRRQNSKGAEDDNKTPEQQQQPQRQGIIETASSSLSPPPPPLHDHDTVERQKTYLHQRSSSSNISNHEQRLLPAPTTDSVMIQSIERHEASGQVIVQIQLPTTTTAIALVEEDDDCSCSSSNPQPMAADESSSSSNNNMSTSNKSPLTAVAATAAAAATMPSTPTPASSFGTSYSSASLENSDDKLAAWWENESKRRQVPPLPLTTTVAVPPPAAEDVLSSTSTTLAMQDPAPAAAPPLPPVSQIQQQHRKLTVETMPAHESALDPQVHRLYAYYQHAVHQDPDPFIIIPVAGADQEWKSGNTEGDRKSDDNHIVDDDNPWWWGNHDNNDGTTAVAAMDSGDQHREQASSSTRSFATAAPNGWVKQLFRAMLQTYRDWPEASQRRIMQHYGQFYDFLVDHPFCAATTTATTTPTNSTARTGSSSNAFELGLHHQHYRINGYLIAVGVVDILPRGLSSVYLFYDPSFSQYLVPLGTFSSLREITWTRDVARLPNYYLGYYIHSNTKMRYKANFKPSQLLCPEAYQWVPANIAMERIERLSPQHHCCRLLVPTDETTDNDAAAATERRIVMDQELKLEVGFGQVVQLVQLQEAARTFLRPFLRDFIEQAGPTVSRQCVIDFR